MLTVIIFAAQFPEDSIAFNIEKGNDSQALSMIEKIYSSKENAKKILSELKNVGTIEMTEVSDEEIQRYATTKLGAVEFSSPSNLREDRTEAGTVSPNREYSSKGL